MVGYTWGMNFSDYEAAFLAVLQGLVAKTGMTMASEGAFQTTVANASGLAKVAAAELGRVRAQLEAEAPKKGKS